MCFSAHIVIIFYLQEGWPALDCIYFAGKLYSFVLIDCQPILYLHVANSIASIFF
jgi:hypothetical protein